MIPRIRVISFSNGTYRVFRGQTVGFVRGGSRGASGARLYLKSPHEWPRETGQARFANDSRNLQFLPRRSCPDVGRSRCFLVTTLVAEPLAALRRKRSRAAASRESESARWMRRLLLVPAAAVATTRVNLSNSQTDRLRFLSIPSFVAYK